MDIEATAPPATVDARAARRIYRHRLPIRLMHWINVVCLTVLLMSGLNIFNAHPSLYWGRESTFASPWISFGARDTPSGPVGYTRIGDTEFTTTGVLGLSFGDGGAPMARAFPAWATRRDSGVVEPTGTCSSRDSSSTESTKCSTRSAAALTRGPCRRARS